MWQTAVGLARWARGKCYCETKEGKLSAAVRCLQLLSRATPDSSESAEYVPSCVVKGLEKILDRHPLLNAFFKITSVVRGIANGASDTNLIYGGLRGCRR